MLKRDKNNTLKRVSAILIAGTVTSSLFLGLNPVNAEEYSKSIITKNSTQSKSEEFDPVYLDSVTPIKVSNGYGEIVYDKANNGNKISLLNDKYENVTYEKGVGAHAASEIIYDIEGKDFLFFEAYAGVDRNSGSYNGKKGTCNFKVFVDDELLFESGILNKDVPAKHIKLDVANAKTIKLVATDGGDGNYCDHANWADAKFLVKAAEEVFSKVSFGASHRWLEIGESTKISAITGYTNKKNKVVLPEGSYTLRSDNEAVATINEDRTITAISDGVANIICTATVDGTTVESSLEVVVGNGNYEGRWVTASPDGSNKIGIAIKDEKLVYYATNENNVVVDESNLGMKTNIGDLGIGSKLKEIETNVIDESYEMISGKKSTNINKANETIYTFVQGDVEFGIAVRAYDDGVAYRYILNGQEGSTVKIKEEFSTFKIPEGTATKAIDFTPQHEGVYYDIEYKNLKGEYIMPVLYQTEDGVWGLITESSLFGNYAGTMIKGLGDGILKASFTPEQGNRDVNAVLPFESSWRTVVMGTPKDIAETVMIENLNPPSEIEDTSWIKPGTTAWTWLNRDATDDYDTYIRYIDLAAEMGWDYVLLDEGWQPKATNPADGQYSGYYPWFDDLMDHANEKGVGILVWAANWDLNTDAKREARIIDWAKKGVKGIKVDFFNSESQSTMKLYDDITKLSAEHHLLVNYHGSNKPTGERRTYQNVLNKEGIHGMEGYLWPPGPNAEETTTAPFARNAVGPMDFTPMADFMNGWNRSFSLAHLTALNIVFEGGIPCFADKPEVYRNSPAYRLYKNFPAAWDDSVLLEGEPGKYVTMMRRNGDNFYVGAICNEERDTTIDLSFLGEGEYYAEIFKDGKSLEEMKTEVIKVTKDDKIFLDLINTGGASLKITKEGPSSPTEITLNKSELTMSQYTKERLEVAFKPENVDIKTVNWSSSDDTIVSVINGEVKAHKPGEATITATTGLDGSVTATCKVRVTEEALKLTDRWSVVREDKYNRRINSPTSVTINTDAGNLYPGSYNGKNIILTEVNDKENFEVTTKLDFAPNQNYQSAGLIVYADDKNSFSIARRNHSHFGGKVLSTYNLTPGLYEGAIPDPNPGEPIQFKVKKEGMVFSAYYSLDGENWVLVDKVLANDNVANAESIKVGVYAFNASNASSKPATFSDFSLNGNVIPFADEELVDGLKPDKVTNFKATDITSTSAKLEWSPVTNTKIKEYVIYKDGKEVATVSADNTELLVDGLRSNSIYGFKILAKGMDEQLSKPISLNIRTSK